MKKWKSINFVGDRNPFYGKKHDAITKVKISEKSKEMWNNIDYRKNHSGENNYNWQGGKSFEEYGFDFNRRLRMQIRERDNFTCQECGYTESQLGYILSIHHIDYNKKNNNSNNLISLCKSCHSKTNFNREDWIAYYQRTTS